MGGVVELEELVTAGLVTITVPGRESAVSSIHIEGESPVPADGALVVAPGAVDADHQEHVIRLAASSSAGAVVVRSAESAARTISRELGVTLCEVGQGVEWSHLIWGVRSLIDRLKADVAPESVAHQGLFAMADAVAAMLGAPVTIEDAHSRVVAYSATTEGLDPTRASTIMSRAVPPSVLRRLRASGVLRRLTQESRPFIVPALEPDLLQRLVIPLRVGDQPVGSIWAIWDGELDPQLEAQLMATGNAAAMSLVQIRAGLDLAGRYSLEFVRATLRGETAQTPAGLMLPLHPHRVVALERLSSGSAADDVSLWRTYFRKRSWQDPMLADVDGLIFAIVPERPGPGGWNWLRGLDSMPGRMGASSPVADAVGVVPARLEATDVLTVVRAQGLRVGSHEELWDLVVLRRASAAVASVEHAGLRALVNDDSHDGRALADTLRTWLELGGDVNDVAARLHVHPNTVRHRLRKLDQRVGEQLRSPVQRLAALLLLKGWAG